MLAFSRIAKTALRDREATVKALVAYATVARDAGELLLPKNLPRKKGARTDLTSSDGPTRFQAVIDEAQIHRDTAHRWQQAMRGIVDG